MLPFSKDTLVIIGVVVCLLGIFYLYREMQKIKKASMAKPSQPVTVYPNWTPTPVNEAKQAPPQPPVVTAPVAAPPPVQKPVEEPDEE